MTSNKRVRPGSRYFYFPNMLDRIDGRTELKAGDEVKVINMPGCPKAGTMGHTFVGDPDTGQFIGLVHVNSLHTRDEYVAYLKSEIKKYEEK
jgi:hypothetical protein